MQPIEKERNWIKQEVEGTIQSMKPLMGGASSRLYEIETENTSIVLRQIDNVDWLQAEPDLVLHEAASLRKASANGLSTPEPLAYDETGEESGLPSILMTKVEGQVVLQPDDVHLWTDGLARALAEIHQIEPDNFSWKYASYTNLIEMKIPEWAKHKDAWQVAFDYLHGEKPEYRETFIHRDYHPANVLWSNNKVSGIVDWPNACRGPAGIDVGHCRVNLALLHGVDVADLFLKAYCRHANDFVYHPFFDIVAIFDFVDEPLTVYKGWTDLGVEGLTDKMMETRMDAFLESIVRRNEL